MGGPPRQRAQLGIEGEESPRVEAAASVDHNRVRELTGGGGKQAEGESELAAGSASGQERQPAAGQAFDSAQAIERGAARPGLRGRQLRRPRQRLAAEADPNCADGVFELQLLHLFLYCPTKSGDFAGTPWDGPLGARRRREAEVGTD